MSTKLALVFLLGILLCSCSVPQDTTALDVALAEQKKNLEDAEEDVKRYGQGSALWALATLRVDIYKNTVAMLEQKRASFIHALALDYSIDGHSYQSPPDKAERLAKLETERAKTAAEAAEIESKAASLGGLVAIVATMQAMTKDLAVAQLDYQIASYRFDFPTYLPKYDTPPASDIANSLPSTEAGDSKLAEQAEACVGITLHSGQDFRIGTWGDSKQQIKCSEQTAPAEEDEERLVYGTEIAGLSVMAIYEFDGDRLVRGMYINTKTHSNKTDYIQDYRQLKDLLTKKYGKPKEDSTVWKNDLYKDDPSRWGMAVSVGHLGYRAMWETARSKIVTGLIGNNYDVSHATFYDEKASAADRAKRDEVETLGKL